MSVRSSVIVILLLFSFSAFSQKTVSSTKEDVIQEAKNQLAIMTSDAGELREFCVKNDIKGEFVIDLTLQGKGKVLTVFMVSSGTDEIKSQNLLKSKLSETQFENIKIPKNERVKFRQTLTF